LNSGRAYPDISCNGQRHAIVWNGTGAREDGTSASTPTCSAVLALLNDALITAGRPTLGFLNPWLYSEGYKYFTDITNGSSAGCNTSGFPATVGWDAVTGFGTPVSQFTEFMAVLLTVTVLPKITRRPWPSVSSIMSKLLARIQARHGIAGSQRDPSSGGSYESCSILELSQVFSVTLKINKLNLCRPHLLRNTCAAAVLLVDVKA
jgi:hypothetical protein